MKIRLERKWQDAWIGCYWRTRLLIVGHEIVGDVVDLWVCLLPCFPVRFTWIKGQWWRHPETASRGDQARGLYRKYFVKRLDGRDRPGQKHSACEYFVLDLTHDRHAAAAIAAYVESCKAEYPYLAADLSLRIASRRLGTDVLN